MPERAGDPRPTRLTGRRFSGPPQINPHWIDRPRALELIGQRFQVRLCVVRAGAGFGKSTLLAQARSVAAPGNLDVALNLVAGDTVATIVADLLAELGAADDGPPTVDRLGDAVWAKAPLQVCLGLDDVHHLDPSVVAELVAGLLAHLPSNGHLLLSGRVRPAVGLERLRLAGQLVELEEQDVAFSDEEVARFLAARGRSELAFGPTHWPALLELECTVGVASAERYLGEEILTLLSAPQRAALERLSVLPDFDLDMVRALTGFTGSLDELVHGVPLVTHRPQGRVALHDIWLEVLRRGHTREEIRALCAMAGGVLREQGRIEEAARVAADGGDDDGLRAVARILVRDFTLAESAAVAGQVLRLTPARLGGTVEIAALEAVVAFASDPTSADAPLRTAISMARSTGDVELELLLAARLAELCFRGSRVAEIGELRRHLEAIEGHEPARSAVASLVGAWHELLSGNHAAARPLLDDPLAVRYEPVLEPVLHYRKVWWAWNGHAARALAAFDELGTTSSGRYSRASIFTALLRWHCGALSDEERMMLTDVLDRAARTGERHLVIEAAATVAMFHLSAGDVESADALIELVVDAGQSLEVGNWGRIALGQAQAVAAVMAGDEERAGELLRGTLPSGGPHASWTAAVHTNTLALGYLLVPGMGPIWDQAELGPEFAVGRQVGQALVALRAGDPGPAARLPWGRVSQLRTWACEPLLVELAVAALAVGNRLARSALEELRSDPQAHIARLAEHPSAPVVAQSGRLRAEVTRRPVHTIELRTLGPLTVLRDGLEVVHPNLRRARVREVLGAVVHYRRIGRRALCSLMWPDKPDDAAANNLRVTLNQLHAVLEPDRSPRVPPWFVRSLGDDLMLVTGDTVVVDVDEFERAIQRGRIADGQGRARECLEAYLEACSWYRGDYLSDAMVQEHGYLDQLRLRSDYAAAATRAAQLLMAQGRAVEARELAGRAAAIEPFLDVPHLVLADAYEAEGRSDLARHVLGRHLTVLVEEGLEPSAELALRARRLG